MARLKVDQTLIHRICEKIQLNDPLDETYPNASIPYTTHRAFKVSLDYIHFAVVYAGNADIFAKAGNRPVAIHWNSNGFAGINCDRYLVYDASGRDGAGLGRGVVERRLSSRYHIRTYCS